VDVEGYLREAAARIEPALDAALPPADTPPASLHAAMRHLLFPGGKRLRPALAFAGAEAVGAHPDRALPAAVAVELIHTYSLVHDDLPCMDDDAERRGRPTVHVAFDEATAVLAGDALQAAAFAALLQAPAEHVAGALADLAEAAGSLQLVGGQHDDLHFQGGRPASVESIHRRKSAALLAASITGGARLGGAEAPALEALGRFGREVGLAFQIADDLLDADDADACSLVAALGAEAARERAAALLAESLREIEAWGERAEPLRELARFAVRRER
jgi:geranylgeranyl pyrophosphate synthase